jgi:glycine/serine hydroxymethyltransferase
MKEAEMVQIADFIKRVIHHIDNDHVIAQVREEVIALTTRFPLP